MLEVIGGIVERLGELPIPINHLIDCICEQFAKILSLVLTHSVAIAPSIKFSLPFGLEGISHWRTARRGNRRWRWLRVTGRHYRVVLDVSGLLNILRRREC